MLGDGRATLGASGAREIADKGTDQASLVDPFVIEASVLRRQKSLLHVLRDLSEGYPHPPLVLLEHFRKAFAPAVEHDACPRKLQSLEFAVIRQISGCLVVEVDDVAEIDDGRADVLVLAKLPVGRLQIREIDAAESLVLVGHCLWIVQGCRDKVLEVGFLEVQGFAHVHAACAKELCDLFVIRSLVEPRFHRIGRGCDLTERQGDGEDFDQDCFHRVD